MPAGIEQDRILYRAACAIKFQRGTVAGDFKYDVEAAPNAGKVLIGVSCSGCGRVAGIRIHRFCGRRGCGGARRSRIGIRRLLFARTILQQAKRKYGDTGHQQRVIHVANILGLGVGLDKLQHALAEARPLGRA